MSDTPPWTLARRPASQPDAALPGLAQYEFRRGADPPVACVAATDLDQLYAKYPGLKKRILAGMKADGRDKSYFKCVPSENRAAFRQCFSNNATNGKCLVPCSVVRSSIAELNLEREARRESIATFVARLSRPEKEWVLGELASSLGVELPFVPQSTSISADATGASDDAAVAEPPRRATRHAAAAAAAAVAATADADTDSGSVTGDDDACREIEQPPPMAALGDVSSTFSSDEQAAMTTNSDDDAHLKRKRGSVGSLFDLPPSPFGAGFLSSSQFGFGVKRELLDEDLATAASVDDAVLESDAASASAFEEAPSTVEAAPFVPFSRQPQAAALAAAAFDRRRGTFDVKKPRFGTSGAWPRAQPMPPTQPMAPVAAAPSPASTVVETGSSPTGGYSEIFAPAGSLLFGATAHGRSRAGWGVNPRDLHATPAQPQPVIKRSAAGNSSSSAAAAALPRQSSFVANFCDPFVDTVMDEPHHVPSLEAGGVAAAAAAAAVFMKPDVKRVVRTGLRRGRG